MSMVTICDLYLYRLLRIYHVKYAVQHGFINFLIFRKYTYFWLKLTCMALLRAIIGGGRGNGEGYSSTVTACVERPQLKLDTKY